MYIMFNKKLKILIICLVILAFAGFVSAESYTAQDGIFAYREVENYTLNGFNFTILADYNLVRKIPHICFLKGQTTP